jgi:hypothetical protein
MPLRSFPAPPHRSLKTILAIQLLTLALGYAFSAEEKAPAGSAVAKIRWIDGMKRLAPPIVVAQ